MLPQREISKLANRLYVEAVAALGKNTARRVPELVIERDYCLAWFLCAMSEHPLLSDALAFKGGTALRRVHFGEYRFSEDLDFSLTRDVALEDLFTAFKEVFARLRVESSIDFVLNERDVTRHIKNDTFYFQYQGPLPAQSSVKVDVTRGETIVFPLERKPVLRTYTEYLDVPEKRMVQVYSFREIIVEKTLAVTDGARREPRDLYDLWYLIDEGHVPYPEELVDGLNRKLASRNGRDKDILGPRLEKVEKALLRAWENRLQAQVMALPEFDGCFREVKRLMTRFDELRTTSTGHRQ